MWSDNDTIIDLLDYKYLVSATTNIIYNTSLLPCTIGIYGDWGSGKSSLMRMVEQSLNKDEKILTIKFNGWLFEGYEDAKSVLMGTILEEIGEKKTITGKAKERLKKMLKQVDYMKVAKSLIKHGVSFATAGPAGLAISGVGDVISAAHKINPEEYLKEKGDGEDDEKTLRMSIRKFHQDFASLLEDLKIDKLVIFIDDLDRCNTDTVIDTLEAIKLFLYVPNSAFVICADEKIIEYAVRRKFPEVPGRGLEVASAYLEKLIQFPIRLPRLNQAELETYINLLFSQLYLENNHFDKTREEVLKYKSDNSVVEGKKFDHDSANEIIDSIPDELQKSLLLTRQITPILTVGLDGNPRQSKRFMNMLMMRIGMAKSKNVNLEIRILAKLMLLEYFKKETFIKLHQFQAEQKGKPKEIKLLEQSLEKESNKELKSDATLTNAEVEIWLKDDWIQDWAKTEPGLSAQDLGPYFYFSRDRLNSTSGIKQQMSSQALSIFHDLTSGSEAFVKKALADSSSLSAADSAAIFDELKNKLLQEIGGNESNSNYKLLFSWVKERVEQLSQLLTFLKSIPHESIPSLAVTELLKVIKGTEYTQDGTDIIREWSNNTSNKDLAKIATSRIKPKN